MSYSMIGATGPGSFKLVGGVAKPIDVEALVNFKAFQQELSRFGALRVDGDIGPATVKLYAKVSGGSWTPSQIATAIPLSTQALKLKAASEGKPAAKVLPPSKPVQKSDGTFSEGNPPPYTAETFMDTAMGFVTSPMGLATAAGVVGLLIFMKRRKGGSTAPVSNPGRKRAKEFAHMTWEVWTRYPKDSGWSTWRREISHTSKEYAHDSAKMTRDEGGQARVRNAR